MTGQKKAVLTILVSFLLGAVAGIVFDQALLRGSYRLFSSPTRYERFRARILEDLNLNAAQQAQLEQLLQRRQEAFNEFRKTIESKYTELREATRDSIRALLTPSQLVKFEALVKEFDTRDRRGGGR
jgi:Skp family chaperone for outer membrane proteins